MIKLTLQVLVASAALIALGIHNNQKTDEYKSSVGGSK